MGRKKKKKKKKLPRYEYLSLERKDTFLLVHAVMNHRENKLGVVNHRGRSGGSLNLVAFSLGFRETHTHRQTDTHTHTNKQKHTHTHRFSDFHRFQIPPPLFVSLDKERERDMCEDGSLSSDVRKEKCRGVSSSTNSRNDSLPLFEHPPLSFSCVSFRASFPRSQLERETLLSSLDIPRLQSSFASSGIARLVVT